jgi:hypothetical protein
LAGLGELREITPVPGVEAERAREIFEPIGKKLQVL